MLTIGLLRRKWRAMVLWNLCVVVDIGSLLRDLLLILGIQTPGRPLSTSCTHPIHSLQLPRQLQILVILSIDIPILLYLLLLISHFNHGLLLRLVLRPYIPLTIASPYDY